MTNWEPTDRWEDEYIEDGERFDHPVPKKTFSKGVKSVAAVVLAAMLFAAGTPLSWVGIATAILMLLIWIDLGSRDRNDVM